MNTELLRIFSSPEETAAAFGRYLVQQIQESASYHCALSGGSTPKLLFQYLAEHHQDLDWSRLHVYWGDERCVAPDDEESNYKMTKELLLDHVGIPAKNIHRVKGENDPSTESSRYADELTKSIPDSAGIPTFDLIILGMGDDGHTASIFPHEIDLLTSEALCAVANHPVSGQKRITLTGQVINAAKEVVFLVTGGGKKDRIAEIFNKNGYWEKYPASYVAPASGKLWWYVDQAAASTLHLD